MKKALKSILLSVLCVSQLFTAAIVSQAAGTTIYDNKTGVEGEYDYELWKDHGTTSMTLNGDGNFSCSWSNIGNALFRKGKKFDCTQTYSQIGDISIDYGCNYQPNGNSYLCVYGWMKDPLVEYYIVESWGTWRPPGATAKGQINVDGATYDVYQTTRVNQPSIEGDTTFEQYWSVRTSKRTSGTISVTEHFKAWESMGMSCGKLYETALNVEGYESSGTADVYKNVISIGSSAGNSNNGSSYNNGNASAGGNSSNSGSSAQGTQVECEQMTAGGQYAGKISSPFSGVALYANNDKVSFNQYFANGTHDFTLRGCSNNSSMARVDLKIGGQNKGTFYFGNEYPAEYTIANVSHGTGNQTVELVVTADDGKWDAYIDKLIISAAGAIGSTGTSSSSSSQGNNGSQNNSNQNSGNGVELNANTKMVALTFDDGPSTTTPYVLDVLEKYNAKATFFLIGSNINESTKATMQRQVNMGCELANHSYSHNDMSGMNAYEVKQEIQRTSGLIKDYTGKDVSFFRAPYLATSSTMFQNANLTFIQGLGCDDYLSNVSASQRSSTVLNNVSDGSIVLLHDFQGNNNTVAALPTIIEGLQSQGYTLVTLSELFYYKGIDQSTPGKIWSNVYK